MHTRTQAVATLCNILDDDLTEGAAEWVASCQTYEGGIGATPGEEAHGGYTFCGLAAMVLLGRVDLLRLPQFTHWLVNRQMPSEGGFQGRTNKLVDGCYSFWQGGSFPLLESVLTQRGHLPAGGVNTLFSTEALLDYLLVCTQVRYGGLRDKPGRGRDYYHTGYCVAAAELEAPSSAPPTPAHWRSALSLVNPVFNVSAPKAEAAIEFYRSL
jgi:protein farnesyltransferase subunit beta